MEQDLFSEIVELHFYKITLLKLKVHATRPLISLNLPFYLRLILIIHNITYYRYCKAMLFYLYLQHG